MVRACPWLLLFTLVFHFCYYVFCISHVQNHLISHQLEQQTATAPNNTTPCVSKVEQEDIRQAFRLLDTEGRGMIDANELRGLMEHLRSDYKDAAFLTPFLNALDKKYNDDSTRMLDIHAFSNLFVSNSENNPNDWNYIFGLFDSENKGYITKENLARVAENLGEQMTHLELHEMIDRASSNNDGKVTLDDFHNVMTKKLFS